jgi:hypothetical protein
MQSVTKTTAQQFIDLVFQGTQSLYEAGLLAAQEIDKDPDFIDKVCDACPDMTHEFVRRMELIGRKKLHPRLAIMENAGARRLRRLPLGLQVKHISEGVPVLIKSGSDWEPLNIDLHNLTPDQAAQAIAEDHIRSEAEQRAYIEGKALKTVKPVREGMGYRVVKDGVSFCGFTGILSRKEMARLLADVG